MKEVLLHFPMQSSPTTKFVMVRSSLVESWHPYDAEGETSVINMISGNHYVVAQEFGTVHGRMMQAMQMLADGYVPVNGT